MPPASVPRAALGRAGEEAAARHLQSLGYRLRARNVRVGRTELDLIAVHGDRIVFCEVKTRRGAAMGAPEEAVTARKQRRLVRAAEGWLAGRPPRGDVRFDVISVTETSAGVLRVRHVPDAFRP